MQKIEVEIQKNEICQVRAPCISEGDVGSAFKRKLALSFSLRQPKVSLICKEKQAPRPFYQTIECGSSKQSHHLHFRQVRPSISQCQTFFILTLVLDYWFIALASNLVKYCTHSALCAEQMGGGGGGGWRALGTHKFAFSLEIWDRDLLVTAQLSHSIPAKSLFNNNKKHTKIASSLDCKFVKTFEAFSTCTRYSKKCGLRVARGTSLLLNAKKQKKCKYYVWSLYRVRVSLEDHVAELVNHFFKRFLNEDMSSP